MVLWLCLLWISLLYSVENDDFDMHVYRNALEGKDSGMGFTPAYRWTEGGEEVTIWIPPYLL